MEVVFQILSWQTPHDADMIEAALRATKNITFLSITVATFHGTKELIICFR